MAQLDGNALDRIFAALAAGDVQAAADCLTHDGCVWHSFDRVEHDRASVMKDWQGFISAFPERAFTDINRLPTPEGFVQRHVMTVVTANGTKMSWPICVVVQMDGDNIARLEEYMDRSGSYTE